MTHNLSVKAKKMSLEKSSRKDKNQNIQVFVRLRPINNREREIKSLSVVEVTGSKEVVVRQSLENKLVKKFTFDRAFGPNSKQVDVYQEVVSPLIDEVLAGYNCTVFAYGQTGTGKTHTMVGESSGDADVPWQNDPMSGIIPRSLSQLFDELRITNSEYTVRVSYLELYNEELFDLLSSGEDNSKLRIYEDVSRKGSNIVNGLEEVTVYNKNEVYKIMAKGQEKRRMACTLMNAQSSRSHTVFTIVVHMKENSADGEELMKIGKLNLVDLAGSENISKAGSDNPARRERARECVNINQSLLTLGRVITSLVERHPHIPYRESKLTRLLQESLGGRTKTSIIATISPGHRDVEETLSTLEYANRARNIQNKPEVNQKITKHAVLKEYSEEIDRLKRDLLASRERNGVYLANETYTEMTLKMEDQDKEIQDQILHIKALKEERERLEGLFSEMSSSLKDKEEELQQTSKALDHTKTVLTNTKQVLVQTKNVSEEQKHLVAKQAETEKKLSEQAKSLLEVAKATTVDVSLLHNTIEKKRKLEDNNLKKTQGFGEKSQSHRSEIKSYLNTFADSHIADLQSLEAVIDAHHNEHLQNQNATKQILNELFETVQQTMVKTEGKKGASIEGLEQYNEGVFTRYSATCEENSSGIQAKMAGVVGLLGRLNETRETDRKSVEVMRQFVQQWKAASTAKVVSLRHVQSKLFDGMADHLKKTLCHHRETSNSQQEQAQRLAELRRQQDEEHSKDLAAIKTLLLAFEEKHKSHSDITSSIDKDLSEAFSRDTESLRKMLQEGNTTLTDKMKDVNDVVTTLDENNKSFVRDLGSMADNQLTNVNAASQVDKDIEASLNETCLMWKEVQQNQIQQLETIKNDLKQKCNETITQQQDHFAKYLQDYQNVAPQVLIPILKTVESVTSQRDYDKAEFERLGKSFVQFREKTFVDLTINDEIESEFLTKEYMLYSPTGKTPNRKEYRYPQDLAATSPHERILKRYRNMKINGEALSPKQLEIINLDQTVEMTPVKEWDNTSAVSSDGGCSSSSSPATDCEANVFIQPRPRPPIRPSLTPQSTAIVKTHSENDIYALVNGDKTGKENLNKSENYKKPEKNASRIRQPSSLKKVLTSKNT